MQMICVENEEGKELNPFINSHKQATLYYSWKDVTYDNVNVLKYKLAIYAVTLSTYFANV